MQLSIQLFIKYSSFHRQHVEPGRSVKCDLQMLISQGSAFMN